MLTGRIELCLNRETRVRYGYGWLIILLWVRRDFSYGSPAVVTELWYLVEIEVGGWSSDSDPCPS